MELIVDVKKVIMAPGEFFEEQAQERDIKTGLIIMGVIFLIGLVGNLLLVSSSNIIESALQSVGLQKEMAIGFLLVLTPIACILSLIIMSAWCGIMHFVANMIGGTGTYKGLMACFLFMQVISIIFIPVSLIIAYMEINGLYSGRILTGLLSLIQVIWFLYLLAVAIKKVYTLSMLKSIIVIVAPGIVAALIMGGLVVLLMPKA